MCSLPRALFPRSATFEDHWGEFSYESDKIPPLFRIALPVICGLQPVNTPVERVMQFTWYKEKWFLCRNVRM